jgi:hypothetical protein
MSLGGNMSSGHISIVNDQTIYCTKEALAAAAQTDGCCKTSGSGAAIKQPVARLPSMVLASKKCPNPSPADFALYPKVAQPSSARTEFLQKRACAGVQYANRRFSQYIRFSPPVPCQALPPEANMAGISKPSTRGCNL